MRESAWQREGAVRRERCLVLNMDELFAPPSILITPEKSARTQILQISLFPDAVYTGKLNLRANKKKTIRT